MKGFVEAAMIFLTVPRCLILIQAAEAHVLEKKAYFSEKKGILAKQITDLCVLMRPLFPFDLFHREERCCLTEMLGLRREIAILQRSPMTLERHQDMERLMI